MISEEVVERLGITCPNKGSFFICDDKPNRFIGCCTIDPCKTSDGICPDENLTATSFDAYSFNQIKPQYCVSHAPEVQFYSCAKAHPPFLGCCSGNPCDGGCKGSNLTAAVLNPDPEKASAFLPDDYNHNKGGLSTGAKAGIAVGCVVAGLAIIGLAAWWFLRRRRQKQLEQQPQTVIAGEKNIHSNHTSHMSTFHDLSPTAGHVPSSGMDMTSPGPLRSTVYDPYGGEHVIGSPATVSDLTSHRSTFISGYEPSAPSIGPYEGYSASDPIPPMPSPSPNQWHPSMYSSNRQSQGDVYPYALNAIAPMPTGHESAYYTVQQVDPRYMQPMPGVPMPQQQRQQHLAELPVMMEGEAVTEAPDGARTRGQSRRS